MWNLPAAAPIAWIVRPAARDVRAQRPDGDKRSADVDGHLHHVGPDDGGHSALEGVEQGERGDERDGEHVSGADGDADHDGDGKDAHTLGRGAGEQEEPCRHLVQGVAEAAVDQLIGGQHLPLKVFGQEERGHHDATEHIADDDLQEAEVAGECQPRCADDGERRCLCRHNRQRNRPPRDCLVGQKVATQRAVERHLACGRAAGRAMAAEAQPEERDCHQVQPNHAEIDNMQANRHCLSIAARRIRKGITPISTDRHRLKISFFRY